ncbi:unnamed protein product [Microthlaspi erraticum]|uniref:Protein kinase domain-containing protein n=1 Tax=Microthlaspi erraticum TaxID=1685480 RepID=A0A6D2JZS9_9BRAS|nr:unnamed protein product [Microthlaspi erraticum]
MAKKIIIEPVVVDESPLTTVSILGRGSFGSVSLTTDSKHQLYAKKSSSFKHMKNLEKELRIMLRFRNDPRILQAASPHLYIGLDVSYILMEFSSIGTLHKIISRFGGKPLPENIIGRSTRMILQGLQLLHSCGYVHCDLKPDNILLFPSTAFGEPWDLKLADFGLSKEPNTDSTLSFPGAACYMPPESVGPHGVIGPALDIWSLGCVVFEMFGGVPVKMGDSYVWRLFQDISPVAIDFLRRCHTWHPSRRACAAELLNHPFITQRASVPLPTRSQQEDYRPFITQRVSVPLPTRSQQEDYRPFITQRVSVPLQPTRQQEDWPTIPRLPGSIW